MLLPDKLDGIGRFAHESLQLITKWHPEHQFYFIFDRKFDEQFIYNSNVIPVVIPHQARHPLLFIAWFEVSLPFVFKKIKPDLFLSPDGFNSLVSDIKSVGVIHDLNFEHFPNDLPWTVRKYYTQMFPRFAKKFKRIATVSEYSKTDISNLYNIDYETIDVVYNGAGNIFAPVSEMQQAAIKKKFVHGCDYFFFVGTLHPRKNLVNLFKAFDEFKKSDTQQVKLVIAGIRLWWTDEIRFAYEGMKYRDEVIFTGRVSDTDLASLMGSALALTYISYFEGFGIPILEAFCCGTPVITSNLTSMPEVAGDATLLVDPFSIDAISNAMKSISVDENLRSRLIRKGFSQKEKFSWNQTAEKLWNCAMKAIEE